MPLMGYVVQAYFSLIMISTCFGGYIVYVQDKKLDYVHIVISTCFGGYIVYVQDKKWDYVHNNSYMHTFGAGASWDVLLHVYVFCNVDTSQTHLYEKVEYRAGIHITIPSPKTQGL